MKKAISTRIKIGFVGVMFLLTSICVSAQPAVVEPGDPSINPEIINTGNFTWKREYEESTKRRINVHKSNREITITDRKETDLGLGETTTILNTKTLEPISQVYQAYRGQKGSYNLQYGTRLKGAVEDVTANKKTEIDEAINGKFFAIDSLNFVISSLPLTPTYRAIIPVIGFNNNKAEFHRYQITDVVESKFYSCVLGNREIWIVNVGTINNSFKLYIDKATRRIFREEPDNTDYDYRDTEADINPIKAPFNATEAKAMITGGTASIQGQAWIKAGDSKDVSQKKQYAPKGSIVMLIPITSYSRELYEFNLQDLRNRNNCSPLEAVPEAKQETLVTDVIDDKGNFVFEGLKTGEFWVTITFVATKYTHTIKTVAGYKISFKGQGDGDGWSRIDVKHWGDKGDFANFTTVKVNKEGEVVKVKLDK